MTTRVGVAICVWLMYLGVLRLLGVDGLLGTRVLVVNAYPALQQKQHTNTTVFNRLVRSGPADFGGPGLHSGHPVGAFAFLVVIGVVSVCFAGRFVRMCACVYASVFGRMDPRTHARARAFPSRAADMMMMARTDPLHTAPLQQS